MQNNNQDNIQNIYKIYLWTQKLKTIYKEEERTYTKRKLIKQRNKYSKTIIKKENIQENQ